MPLGPAGPGRERLPGWMGCLVTALSRRGSPGEHSRLGALVQGPWKVPGSATNSVQLAHSQGRNVWLFGLAGGGAVAGHPGAHRRWLLRRARGQPGAPPPASPPRSRHGKLLRANVAGTMESPGLPSAEILGCVSYAHRHGSSENPVSTRPLHITVFFQQLLYFGTEGGEGGEESWREWQEGMSQDPTYVFFFLPALRCMSILTHCTVYRRTFI